MNDRTVPAKESLASGAGSLTRRSILRGAATAAAIAIVPRHVLGGPGHVAPSEKLTLAGIGLGLQGTGDIVNFLQLPLVQVTALCDVNKESTGYISWNYSQGKEQRAAGLDPAIRIVQDYYAQNKPSGTYHGCNGYRDYRELLEKEDIDAVVIATPDHSHAVISMAAIKKGKHVYCEKPLAYTVSEARQVTEAAKHAGVATQLGNQGQASEEARVVREYLMDGVIGPVHEVHVSSPARFWQHALYAGRPTETPPVPKGFDWDLWLGPAPERPYHPAYCPWTWRNWWEFGTGLLGDLGCHKLSPVFKALKLGHPTSIEACCTLNNKEVYPFGVIARFEFPARGDMPPVTLNWYDGGLKGPRPKDIESGRGMQDVICVGEKGTLNGRRLAPDAMNKNYGHPPKILPRSVGHHQEFVDACRGGPPAGANFADHGGPLSEVFLLGNVALRAGSRIEWDGPNMKITNNDSANDLLQREYRKGWSL